MFDCDTLRGIPIAKIFESSSDAISFPSFGSADMQLRFNVRCQFDSTGVVGISVSGGYESNGTAFFPMSV